MFFAFLPGLSPRQLEGLSAEGFRERPWSLLGSFCCGVFFWLAVLLLLRCLFGGGCWLFKSLSFFCLLSDGLSFWLVCCWFVWLLLMVLVGLLMISFDIILCCCFWLICCSFLGLSLSDLLCGSQTHNYLFFSRQSH